MKHPFQILKASSNGEFLVASVKNTVYVSSLKDGRLLGTWCDELDSSYTILKQHELKLKKLEEAERENEEGDAPKKTKTNDNKAVKVPKIPVPGPGAPQIYNYIRTLELSKEGDILVLTTDSDKSVVIFKIDLSAENCLIQLKRQPLPKRPCAVSLSLDKKYVTVADKFGDVYNILIDDQTPAQEKDLRPILGHVSMLVDIAICEHGGKSFILSADRDEHIRVSNYPKSYVIKGWLYGHSSFISNLHISSFDSNLLISGGGDDYLCLWNWYDEKLLNKVQLRKLVEHYLTDFHLPPERFLSEDSIKEISISKILTYHHPTTDSNLLFVLCENVKAILAFRIEKDYTVNHIQTLALSTALVDLTLIDSDSVLIGSKDTDSQTEIIEFYSINDGGNLEVLDNKLSESISSLNKIELNSREEFYPLYYIHTLRKRSEH